MDNTTKNVKKLIINGKQYCRYEVSKKYNTIFMKVDKPFPNWNIGDSEYHCASIINCIEGTKIMNISFLNI